MMEKNRKQLKRDIESVITFLEGDVAREKIINFIETYILKRTKK